MTYFLFKSVQPFSSFSETNEQQLIFINKIIGLPRCLVVAGATPEGPGFDSRVGQSAIGFCSLYLCPVDDYRLAPIRWDLSVTAKLCFFYWASGITIRKTNPAHGVLKVSGR